MGPSRPCLPHQPCKYITRSCQIGQEDLYPSVHPPQIPMFKHKLDCGLRERRVQWWCFELPPRPQCYLTVLYVCFVVLLAVLVPVLDPLYGHFRYFALPEGPDGVSLGMVGPADKPRRSLLEIPSFMISFSPFDSLLRQGVVAG